MNLIEKPKVDIQGIALIFVKKKKNNKKRKKKDKKKFGNPIGIHKLHILSRKI